MEPTEDATIDAYIGAAAVTLGLTIEPEWLPGVKASLMATTRATALVESFPLPDDAEPAPVFDA